MLSPTMKGTLFMRTFGITKVPMLFYLSPTVTQMDDKKTVIKIPLNYRTKNHLKSMYFGALAAGADLAGGFTAMKIIHESGKKVQLSFKDFKADFKLRAESDTFFENNQGQEVKEFVEKVIANPGERFNMPLVITAKCPKATGDEPVAEFTLTLSLKLKA